MARTKARAKVKARAKDKDKVKLKVRVKDKVKLKARARDRVMAKGKPKHKHRATATARARGPRIIRTNSKPTPLNNLSRSKSKIVALTLQRTIPSKTRAKWRVRRKNWVKRPLIWLSG
jgi:hypothetical protein